jgi:hypothetical protein
MNVVTDQAQALWLVFLTLPVITQFAITLLLISALIAHLFKYTEQTIHDGPSIFTTAGIFFTFLGIAEGLYGFDPQKIDASIPTLLDGLKTAFIASVVGVGAALSIKLRFALFGLRRKAQGGPTEGATVDDLCYQMIAVHQALVGDDDSTLLSQIKLSRQDTNDRLDKLRQSQTEFMQKMADNNSKALIQALQEVIRDFNTKISEQFGENFKQLNAAVGHLLTWQEQYRTQLSELIAQQTRTAENMRTASDRYAVLVDRAESFSNVANQLSTLLQGLDLQRTQLEGSLKSLAHLLTVASGSLPQIESKIVEMTEQVTRGVKQNQDEIGKSVRDTGTKIVQLTEQVTYGVKQNQDEMTKAVRDAGLSFQTAVGDLKDLLQEALQATNSRINEHMKQIGDKATDQIAKLDLALETELSRSINSLGRQLTALSARFVEDYGPLTDKLRMVVQASKGA